MNRKFEFSIDEYYHLYSRGTEKREIFLDQQDRERFTALLYITNSDRAIHLSDYWNGNRERVWEVERGKPLVALGAYCLMPNHFHLLVREQEEGGSSLFMQKLMTSYSMYFNKKYHRSGSLWEGRFKAVPVTKDRQLEYLFSYIHLNPVKLIDSKWREQGIRNIKTTEEFLKNYRFSSYIDYGGQKRLELSLLNKEIFPDYFPESDSFFSVIREWLDMSRSDLDSD